MAKAGRDLKSEIDQKGFALLDPIVLTPTESELLGMALFVDPHQPLMHYLSLGRFRSMLQSQGIYMRRLDLFHDDPLEGRLPAANAVQTPSFMAELKHQLGFSQEFLERQRGFINGLYRELTYIHCWFRSANEDRDMWAQYGVDGAGICIQTTAQRLLESVVSNPDLGVDLHGVAYFDEQTPIPETPSFLAACRKRTRFRHEQEVRLVATITHEASFRYSGEAGIVTADHVILSIRFDRLIQAVFVGPRVDSGTFLEIEKSANAAAGSTVVRRSSMPIS